MASDPVYATLFVIGKDRSGVIARVTQWLFEKDANIEALEEHVTRGEFNMTLQASWPSGALDREGFASSFHSLLSELGMEGGVHWLTSGEAQRFAILVTREPHVLEALMQAVHQGTLKAEPVVVIGNRADLEEQARSYGLPFHRVDWSDRLEGERAALSILRDARVDFLVLARFMKILSPQVVWRYKNKILNIHPSLLPSFPGPQAYRQAVEHGAKVAGVTAHFVDVGLDEGPIIAQSAFAIPPGASVKDVVTIGQQHESATMLKAVELFLSNRLDVGWGRVREV